MAVRKVKKDGKFYTDSVPFSCCSFDSTGPCIHDDVLQTYSRYGYNPAMKLTINTDGCSAVVSDTLQTPLVGLVLIGLSVVAVSIRDWKENSKFLVLVQLVLLSFSRFSPIYVVNAHSVHDRLIPLSLFRFT